MYAYEQAQHAELTADEIRRFKKHKAAWTYFEGCPPSYRKVLLHWIAGAKKPDTRAQRLDKLIQASTEGLRLR